ncbi:hypothetical protein F3Y22_tig00110419pilonHSYRG00081 [Hibiscus syriacus]|uniref:Reverse transcriptase zinc-binding domain-containing protein n=1 Tax=Hibiscus syriacus TaxID=106335 RepID=A0A6A3AQL0_HIBSY|nr:hypothetical protein F3Y22_tig00110419pilonHSYRG00081 [Hibiscus syriacus]
MRFFWKGGNIPARGAQKILAGEGSLWIAWINAYCFRVTDFWNVDCKLHFSWILVKMLKLISEALSLFCSGSNWTQIKVNWIWENIRSRYVKVSWHRLVWFPGHIPKFSLISWMAILHRLPTKDRLAKFGLPTDNACGLCNSGIESHNHLFFECLYAKSIWRVVLLSCGLTQEPLNWSDNLQWMV